MIEYTIWRETAYYCPLFSSISVFRTQNVLEIFSAPGHMWTSTDYCLPSLVQIAVKYWSYTLFLRAGVYRNVMICPCREQKIYSQKNEQVCWCRGSRWKASSKYFLGESILCSSKIKLPYYSVDYYAIVCIYCGVGDTQRWLNKSVEDHKYIVSDLLR